MEKCEFHPVTASKTCRICRSLQGSEPVKPGFQSVVSGSAPKKQGVIPVHGDKHSFNLSTLVRKNMYASRYFNDLMNLKSFNEVVSELETHCRYVEPWTIGSTSSPSTLFCCLYRIFHFKISEGQMKFMLEHPNVYLRCLGALYLRILSDPTELWSRLKSFLTDSQPVNVNLNTTITFGEFIEQLLVEQSYYGVQLPRIPVLCQRELAKLCLLIPGKRARFKEITAVSLEKDTPVVVFMDDGSVLHAKFKNIQGRKAQIALESGEMVHVDVCDVAKQGGFLGNWTSGDLESRVKQQEIEKSLAETKLDYAKRPQSYKSALSQPMEVGTKRRRSRSNSPVRDITVVPAPPSPSHFARLEELKRLYCSDSRQGHDLSSVLQPSTHHSKDLLAPEKHSLGD